MVHRGVVRLLLPWLLGRRRLYRVRGASMRPTLAPGDLVLVDPRAYRADRPRRGEVVVARHPFRADLRLVKRVVATREDGRCVLAGDDRGASTDSRTLGAVPGSLILGRVVARLGGRDVPRT